VWYANCELSIDVTFLEHGETMVERVRLPEWEAESAMTELRSRANLGDLERMLRIIIGSVLNWLGYTKMKGSPLGRVVGFWGVDLAVSGILGWCWLYASLGLSSVPGAANNPYEKAFRRLQGQDRRGTR
jgi:hypothetical protein